MWTRTRDSADLSGLICQHDAGSQYTFAAASTLGAVLEAEMIDPDDPRAASPRECGGGELPGCPESSQLRTDAAGTAAPGVVLTYSMRTRREAVECSILRSQEACW